MITLVKTTLKLLFRNVAFWCFLLITPLISLLIMNLNHNYQVATNDNENYEIVELQEGEKVSYYGTTSYAVKVYDACGSRLSNDLLNDLASVGMYKFCRVGFEGKTFEDYQECVKKDAYNDRMGAAIYIPEDFDERLYKGEKDTIMTSVISDDERTELFLDDMELTLGQMIAAGDAETFEKLRNDTPAKEIVAVPEKGEIVLTTEQSNEKMEIGYAMAFLTMGFVFCGIFVAHTAITEQKNLVHTRIMLTGDRYGLYFVSKFVVSFIVSLMLTVIVAVGLVFVDIGGLGVSKPMLVLIVFLLGVVESALSLLLGIVSGEIMSSNFVAFTLWALSSCLSGLYFPLDDTTKLIKALSFLMPQKWFMSSVDMFYTQDNNVYFVLLCITVAYLILILSIGSVGLKLRKQYE